MFELFQFSSSTVTYHHPDHLSNRADTDAAGNVTRRGHAPFGESWYDSGSSKLKFTTYERDGESKLDYAQFRNYASGFGRYMSADLLEGKLQGPQSLNHYSYVANDPVNNVDPLGLTLVSVCGPGITSIEHTEFNGEDRGTTVNWGIVCHQEMVFDDIGGGVSGDPLGGGLGGGGGDGANPAPKVDTKVLADCIAKIFGTVLLSFTPSQMGAKANPSSDGSFVGFGIDTHGGSSTFSGALSVISITNDAHSKSASQITLDAVNQGQLEPGVGVALGYTIPSQPYTNFSANSMVDPQELLLVQIFELGNSLTAITGIGKGPRDETFSSALQDCYIKGTFQRK